MYEENRIALLTFQFLRKNAKDSKDTRNKRTLQNDMEKGML